MDQKKKEKIRWKILMYEGGESPFWGMRQVSDRFFFCSWFCVMSVRAAHPAASVDESQPITTKLA